MTEGLLVSDIIAISGHRDYPDPGAFYKGLDTMKAREYVFGGARGADTNALKYMARTQPNALRTVVVPNRVMDQPYEARAAIRLHGQKVIELRNTGAGRYQIRNQFMVDRSTHTRAFYDHRGYGGTYNTIRYAKLSGKSYDIWSMSKVDQAEFMLKSKDEFDTWLARNKDLKVNLDSCKGFAVAYIKQNLGMGVQAYLRSLGREDENTLEEYFAA